MNKILIIDLCNDENSLHFKEFVQPVIDILRKQCVERSKTNESVVKKNYEVQHFKKLNLMESFEKIILCGVALKDFEYQKNLEIFKILKDFQGDVLGICAGAQIIGQLFGGSLKEGQEIGLIDLNILKEDKIFNGVDLSEVYCLHNKCLDSLEEFEILATSRNYVQVFKHNNFYGVLFHPEVRNKSLIKNFINL